jgi:CubicO group peptidase (beta-lactamase class C family)
MEDYMQEVTEGVAAVGIAPDIFEKLEELIRFQLSTEEKPVRDVLTAFGTPIVSVGILDAGHITAKVLGFPSPQRSTMEPELGGNFDNDTLFQAASISKAITALAVMKLCQVGELGLDTLISTYLNSVSSISRSLVLLFVFTSSLLSK